MDAHKSISFIKSGFRLSGCIAGCFSGNPAIALAFVILFVAEIVGIVEEMVV